MNDSEFDSQELFQAFMSHSPVVAFMKDEQGRYVYVNKCWENLFSLTLADIQGKSDFALMPEETAQQFWENDRKVFSSGQPVELIETIPAAGGAITFWTVIKFPFTDAKGQKFVGGVAIDITKQKEDEEKLRRSERHYRHLIESSQGFICTHDREGNILSVNPAAAQSLGYNVSEMLGKNLREFVNPEYHQHFNRRMKLVWNNAADNGFMSMRTKDGQERTWKYHNVKLTETVEEPFVLGYAQDVTDMQEIQEQLKSLPLTDDLTNLYNRRGFLTLAERQLRIARSRRTGKGVYLIFADMDGLKQINDRFGHNQGSLAITKMSEILAGNFRASDILARLGGDEFVVLVVDADDATQGIVLNRLQARIENYNAQKNHPFDLALSVGISLINLDDTKSLEEILAEADQSMYQQKRNRKSRL
ncbi:MAG: PAS domain S-box protein [Pyrinomonadaceae bacterium]|nr:PAS domain S-box protein [Pyrinomonadaceae bacterium]